MLPASMIFANNTKLVMSCMNYPSFHTDVQIIRAEGLNLGEEVKAQAVKQAHENIALL